MNVRQQNLMKEVHLHGNLASKLNEPGICEYARGFLPMDSWEHADFAPALHHKV
jgi:hypothetical protein